MEKTREKYNRILLSFMYERALRYKALSLNPTRSAQAKALWKALAQEAAEVYNYSLRTLGIESDKLPIIKTRTLQEWITEEEIEEIVLTTFAVAKAEKAEHLAKLREATAHLMLPNESSEVKRSFELLIKKNVLTFGPDGELVIQESQITGKEKGAQVSAFVRAGYNIEIARKLVADGKSLADLKSIVREPVEAKTQTDDSEREARRKKMFEDLANM